MTADPTQKKQQVRRTLTLFSMATDELLAEYDLLNFNLAGFKQHFNSKQAKYFEAGGEDDDPLMYTCYEVKPEDVDFISTHLAEQVTFDFDKYAYFVEATAITSAKEVSQ